MFDEDFIKQLAADKLVAGSKICERFWELDEQLRSDTARVRSYEKYLEAFAFAEVFVDANSLELDVPRLDQEYAPETNLRAIRAFFGQWRTNVEKEMAVRKRTTTYETAKQRYAQMFGKGVMYEFSDDDFSKVQNLLNRLRELLKKSTDFEEEHRVRLLKKLEALQVELHKKMSDFDKFWGFFIDSGIALRKFWENVEPFRDDVKEIMRIVCRTQAKAENVQKILPLNLLTDGGEGNDKNKS